MRLAITKAGRMLLFPVSDLPQLSKGKGNKIINITGAQAASGEDLLVWLMVIPPRASITLYFGKRKLKFKSEDLQKYRAERGRKGTSLPRGLHNIERIDVDSVDTE